MRRLFFGIAAFFVVLAAWGADEITVTALLKVDNGYFELLRNESNYRVTQTGTAADYGIQAIAVAPTNNLNIANVTTPGYCFFRNLSTTTNVIVTLTLKLRPGDIAVLPALSTNIDAYCEGGTANLEYWVNEE